MVERKGSTNDMTQKEGVVTSQTVANLGRGYAGLLEAEDEHWSVLNCNMTSVSLTVTEK